MILVALLFLATPVDVDKITPQKLQGVSKTGKIQKQSNLMREALKTMYNDALNGDYCSDFFLHDVLDQDSLADQMKNKGFNVTNYQSENHHVQICWNGK